MARSLMFLGLLLPACALAASQPPRKAADPPPGGPLLRLGSGQWRPGGAVHAIAFSPDDKLIATAIGEHVTLWDAGTGRFRISALAPNCSMLTFAGDSKSLTLATREKIGRWNFSSAGARPALTPGKVIPPGMPALSPDGQRFALATPNKGLLIKSTAGKTIQTLDQLGIVYAVAWFPDSRTLAAMHQDGKVHLWDTVDKRDLRQFPVCPPTVEEARMAVSGDGQWLAVTARFAKENDVDGARSHELCVFEPGTGRRLKVPHLHDSMPELLTFSPDGSLVLSQTRTEFYLWEAASGAVLRPLNEERSGIVQTRFAPDGLGVAVVAGDGTAHFVDLLTDTEQPLLPGRRNIRCVAFSVSGQTLATGHANRTVEVWKSAAVLKHSSAAKIEAEQLLATWQALGGDARSAYLARRALIAAPELAVALLREQLKPQPAPDADRIAQWIGELNASQFKVRDKATQALEHWPELAESPLRKALEGKPTLEVRRRVESLLEKFAADRPTGEVLRWLRAIAVLSAIGSSDAQAVLGPLTEGGSNLRIRQAAKAALERLQPAR